MSVANIFACDQPGCGVKLGAVRGMVPEGWVERRVVDRVFNWPTESEFAHVLHLCPAHHARALAAKAEAAKPDDAEPVTRPEVGAEVAP